MKNLSNTLQPTDIEGVYAAESDIPGITATVVGGTHGDETAGLVLIEKLKHHPIKQGKLYAIVANPEAVKMGKRFIEEDLNRCFGTPPEDNKTSKIAGKKKLRAEKLKPIYAETDIFLDVHSTILPSDPFLAIPNLQKLMANKALISSLGIPTILTGEGLWHPSGEPIYGDTYVESKGGFGITIEAGWIGDPKTMEIIQRIYATLQYLKILEKADHAVLSQPQKELEIWHAQHNIVATSGFTFVKEGKEYQWSNFEKLSEGTTYAVADGKQFRVDHDMHIIFPKPKNKIIIGNEACIIAKKLTI